MVWGDVPRLSLEPTEPMTMPAPGMGTATEVEITIQKPMYTCVLCPPSSQKKCEDRVLLRNHISRHHNYAYSVHCPYGDWEGTSADELQQHFDAVHSATPLAMNWEIQTYTRVQNQPKKCPICGAQTSPCARFFDCTLDHCPLVYPSFACESDTEDSSRLDTAQMIVAMQFPRLPSSDAVSRDLLLDEYINNPLFATCLARNILRNAVPQRRDKETTRAFLNILLEALDDFANKVGYDGERPDCEITPTNLCAKRWKSNYLRRDIQDRVGSELISPGAKPARRSARSCYHSKWIALRCTGYNM
ncbi:hypothetical protein BJX70DRAFT_194899 [Aspergillus crustosus]